MRIIIDMQGAQSSGSRNRGIGRYARALAKAIVENRCEHDVVLALNGLFAETIEPIRAAFNELLPRENIRVWYATVPVNQLSPDNSWRQKSAELLRETFIASLKPDVILITSLFEGLDDNTVTSISAMNTGIPTATILYDLIPLIYRMPYLKNPVVESWYENKLAHIRRADMLLAISESSRQEALTYLGFSDENTVNISTAADSQFQPIRISRQQEVKIRKRYGLSRAFVMYTGGSDHRKNIEGLVCAFAQLPKAIRSSHQLAVVCVTQPEEKTRLEELGRKHGLAKNDLILTGFVSEEDLIALYNLCKLFVFPSWHEGFGLPVLEAMSCGKAVIGANTSSVPEVIGRDDALFDPRSDEAISAKVEQVLSDDIFRRALEKHGRKQAKKFSWDKTAKTALKALEKMYASRQRLATRLLTSPASRPKMAFISPLPPEQSGISDYSAELLPELCRHYDIDVVIAQEVVLDPYINSNCSIKTVDWFKANAKRYDRVLYHFGNSEFHQHMFDLLEEFPGTVVLHDFYLSGIIHHMQANGLAPDFWIKELYRSHGYGAVQQKYKTGDVNAVIREYPCSRGVFENAHGVIVHSETSQKLAEKWYGSRARESMTIVPLLRTSIFNIDHADARRKLGFASDDFIICSFGMLDLTKLNHELLEAWLESDLSGDEKCHLVFVGQNQSFGYGEDLSKAIKKSGLGERIRITGWADKDMFRDYLAAADMGVQLRTLSRGETSAAVLDCMNYGLPTIVNANGSMADLPEDTVYRLPDEFSTEQLVKALGKLRYDKAARRKLGTRAHQFILNKHAPGKCADQYAEAIELFHHAHANGIPALNRALAAIEPAPAEAEAWLFLADAVACSISPHLAQRQLLVDVSQLVQVDSKTGIQRVVSSILQEWIKNQPAGLRIEPVYASVQHGYRYARKFTMDFLDCPVGGLVDEPIEYRAGDIFIGLDLEQQVVWEHRNFYQQLRNHGVIVKFIVYDLLCILMPQHFIKGAAVGFGKWLEVVTQSDGVVCISKAAVSELEVWLEKHGPDRLRPFDISWFHLGADVDWKALSTSIPDTAVSALEKMRSNIGFLMVGTLEPRKGHAQTLDAFERLWAKDTDVCLVIIGKFGWLVDKLAEKIRGHREYGQRLFWLEDINDEILEKTYAASTCLIAASEGEGFGLPIVEAAQHGLPIMARDITVFREIAENHAFYFDASDGLQLAVTIENWLKLYHSNKHPKSTAMPWLKWEQSAKKLLSILVDSELENQSL